MIDTTKVSMEEVIAYVTVSLYFARAYTINKSYPLAELHIMDAKKGIAFLEHLENEQ